MFGRVVRLIVGEGGCGEDNLEEFDVNRVETEGESSSTRKTLLMDARLDDERTGDGASEAVPSLDVEESAVVGVRKPPDAWSANAG